MKVKTMMWSSCGQMLTSDKVDIVVHTAGIVDPNVASNLINALGQRQRQTDTQVYYVHVSNAACHRCRGQI